ncbi:MAG: hypothetical protein Q9O62_00800 [Ardenticatenia bacterium]|nr:hypothetical protein [Ardenticatenia bacterium]
MAIDAVFAYFNAPQTKTFLSLYEDYRLFSGIKMYVDDEGRIVPVLCFDENKGLAGCLFSTESKLVQDVMSKMNVIFASVGIPFKGIEVQPYITLDGIEAEPILCFHLMWERVLL